MNDRSTSCDDPRLRILSAAVRIFTRHGFGTSGMRMIAAEAGVSVGALYLHFRSKEELYLTLLQDMMEELNSATAEALANLQSPAEELAAFIRMTLDFGLRHRDMILLQGRELGFSFGIEHKRDFFRMRRRQLEEIVLRGIESGAFRPCDTEQVSRVVFSMLRGFILSLAYDDEALYDPEAAIEMVLHSLKTQKSGADS